MTKQKLRVAFDARALARPHKSGVGYYEFGLIKALTEQYPDELELIGHYYNFLGRAPVELPTGANIHYKVSRLLPEKLVNLLRRFGIEIPFELLTKARVDVHFFPNYLTSPSLFKTPTICTIHDLAYLDLPATVSQRNRQDLTRFVPVSVRRSRLVATVSEAAKERIREEYGTAKEVLVTYTPPSQKPSKTAAVDLDKFGVEPGFILFLGNLEPRKNVANLIRAYRKLPAAGQAKHQLVLAGAAGWNDEEIDYALKEAKQSKANVITLGYVDEATRQALYEQATVFALPSLYEGQGIPPLEAMSFGCPVLVSDIPVLHEVCGDAALYCQPQNQADITSQLAKLLTDKKLRGQLVAVGHKQVKNYSWDKVAKTFMEAFTSLV